MHVVIVGAGLSGLCCARTLLASGATVTVLDASDAIGGRVRTDVVEGFRLDRGFQVLLTSYPEVQRVLDLDALDLQPFSPGAEVWLGSAFATVSDPFREPLAALPTALSPVGTFADKLRVLNLRQSVRAGIVDDLWERPETTTIDALRNRYGFSDLMIEQFFRPFLGGVLLDPSLVGSSRAFEFYFRMFSEGDAAVPAMGMQAIPEQLATAIPPETMRFNTRVESVQAGRATLASGEVLDADAVVVATEGPEAARLTGTGETERKSTVCLYWAADSPPVDHTMLMLDGTGNGPVNNVQVMSNVAPTYAPDGQTLISASVLGTPEATDEALEQAARTQLRGWFGAKTERWRHLRTDRVTYALPDLLSLEPPERPLALDSGVFVTGDHRRNASINGAMVAGRHAAEAVLASQ
ncbi:NAD(P)/FAD-dependent oxidoreductase [Rubricoccus marinus]|uniref:Amine oxidase domain-containing protein n=1 Tax=Rubricoccus marinus TaxID=716817 RepID=A0A259TY87_9BACT|nr:NAD(P)/FAD-dependent oxidoreductase [Rubricoccus marinus]OZC02534.1 hypothetical protein BSZ36_05820 [Rubricoccus marinus]